MSLLFPDQPIFKGAEAPTRLAVDVQDLEIEGLVPASINGSFFRVQPDPAYPPWVENDILFNGDGVVGAFRIQNGHVDYRQRYVETPKYLAEKAARRALFGHYRNPFFDDPSVAGFNRTTANTNVLVHAGKLLAIKEDGLPFAMNPLTLETLGEENFGGRVTGATFTAHPKTDPISGDLIGMGYEAHGLGTDDVVFYQIDRHGKLVREVWFKAPHAAMIHDWGVTQNYAIFPVMPQCSSIERMKAGLPRFFYRKELDIHIGVMPRDGDGKDVKWFRIPNGFPGHTFNAFDDGHMVYLDMTIATDNVFDFFPDVNGHSPHMMTVQVPITRVAMNMNTGEVSTSQLIQPDQIAGDFMHCDERYATLPYRYAVMNALDMSKDYDYDRLGPPFGMMFNSVGLVDLATGTAKKWWPGPTSSMQEPVFVPRSADAPEGDGYMLAVVNRLLENRCDLVILDTDGIEDGPVATVKLPFRLRTALHGNWVNADRFVA